MQRKNEKKKRAGAGRGFFVDGFMSLYIRALLNEALSTRAIKTLQFFAL